MLLGGRRGTAAMRIEGRPYTTIERTLVQRMTEVILQDMTAAFEPLAPVNFALDRLETNPRFAAIARPANAAILVKLRIDMEDRGGRTELLLPYATLEPIRKLLLQQFMGEKFGRDSIWENHLATELWSTKLDIAAILDEQVMSLNKVMDLKVGDTMMLNATPEFEDPTALRERAASERAHGPGRQFRRRPHRRAPSSAPMPRAPFSDEQGTHNGCLACRRNRFCRCCSPPRWSIARVLERKLTALRKGQDGLKDIIAELNGAITTAGTSMRHAEDRPPPARWRRSTSASAPRAA